MSRWLCMKTFFVCCIAAIACVALADASANSEDFIQPLQHAARDGSGSCGKNLTWSFDSNSSTLKISGSGEMFNFTSGSSPWNSIRMSIHKVDLPIFLTSIGDYAFYNCDKLESVIIHQCAEFVGSYAFYGCKSLINVKIARGLRIIGNKTFNGCSNLMNITIPNSVTSIGGYAFSYCTNLKSVTLPTNLKLIEDYTFSGCTNLTQISFPTQLQKIGWYAFSGCTSLINVRLTNRTERIESHAFSGCSSLREINISESTTSIGTSVFEDCINLKNVTISSRYMESIPVSAFQNCKSLENINIPSTVSVIARLAFSGCTSLKMISLPSSVSTIGDNCFSGCSSLENVTISNTISLNNYGKNVFEGCINLNRIDVDEDNEVFASIDGILYDKSRTTLYQYPCGRSNNLPIPPNTTSIYDTAFAGCTRLTNVTIPSNVNSIGGSAFSNCTNLESVLFESNISTINANAFSGCNKLTSVFYGGMTAPQCLDDVFINCSIEFVCVPPEYEGEHLCEIFNVNKSESCYEQINQCFTISVNGSIVKRSNATEWEHNSTICVQHKCDNSTGAISISQCAENEICMNGDECVDKDTLVDKWTVEIDMDDNILDFNFSSFTDSISIISGIDSTELEMSVELDSHGQVLRIIVITKNENDANVLADVVNLCLSQKE